MSNVTLENISKLYDHSKQTSVSKLNLAIRDGEFVVIVGPSGCGKSTTLRMIAGLETISEGKLYIDDELVNTKDAKDRNIAMVFQNYALYPTMTVRDNMGFALKMHRVSKKEIDRKVREVAGILQLEPYLDRKPAALSGGQRQRVALGRAMVRQPKVFLLDEPLSNLDAKLRVTMRAEIVELHRKLHTTFIYVTHDQTEALTMADRIAVMNRGKLEQFAAPKELYWNPANLFVAEFIGSPQMNTVAATLFHKEGAVYVRLPSGADLKLPDAVVGRLKKPALNPKIYLGFRPEHIRLARKDEKNTLCVHVQNVEDMGYDTFVYFHMPGSRHQLVARLTGNENIAYDADISFVIDMDHVYLFDGETEQSLLTPVSDVAAKETGHD